MGFDQRCVEVICVLVKRCKEEYVFRLAKREESFYFRFDGERKLVNLSKYTNPN